MPARRTEEVEIKFAVTDRALLGRALKAGGFRVQTPRTFESNILYDFSDARLRRRGEVLRVRLYGDRWTLTYKARAAAARHKRREEIETSVSDGHSLEFILIRLGLRRSFAYEKYRTEWTDGRGHVVLDETPIGDFAEIEGRPRWIDATARRLGVTRGEYITGSYADLFSAWRRRTGSRVPDMTFALIKP